MKFELKKAKNFGWPGLKGQAFNDANDFPRASTAYFEVTGRHGRVKTTQSDRIYFIIEGEGEFDIDGKTTRVSKTDVVIVPKNTPYDYRAISKVLKLFLVHCPAFSQMSEIELE